MITFEIDGLVVTITYHKKFINIVSKYYCVLALVENIRINKTENPHKHLLMCDGGDMEVMLCVPYSVVDRILSLKNTI